MLNKIPLVVSASNLVFCLLHDEHLDIDDDEHDDDAHAADDDVDINCDDEEISLIRKIYVLQVCSQLAMKKNQHLPPHARGPIL